VQDREHLSWLHRGGDPDVDPDAVGVKAANLVRMARAGLPVPPGFVLDTSVCATYHAQGERLGDGERELVAEGVREIEHVTGLRFGATRHPLLVSVRSGAAASMPGMLETILDVGLCDTTLPGLLRATGNPVFVWDSYRRLVQTYGEVVAGCAAEPFAAATNTALREAGVPDVSELGVAGLRNLVAELLEIYRSAAGRPFPQHPMQQLLGAVEAVLRSWNADRAVGYRRLRGLNDLTGTAVTVQAMVFGNLGTTSGSGVGFTRDPSTGENRFYLDFLLDVQGEDVVAGRNRAGDAAPFMAAIPGLGDELQRVRGTLEAIFGDAQDFEFTVENGKLWLLQTRTAKRTPWAALQIACDLVDEGVIDPAVALERLREYDLDRIVRVRVAVDDGADLLAIATPASAGAAAGEIALDVDTALRRSDRGAPVVLVRDEASTGDIAALATCRALLTSVGARTSHAAVVARQLGVVCVVDCHDLSIDLRARKIRIGERGLREGDTLTVDGTNGRIFRGEVAGVEERPTELLERVRAWEFSPTTVAAPHG
jgi:pyruvate, orthophosphate dikinase